MTPIVKLSPMLIARHEVTRSKHLVMEARLLRENARLEIIEVRQAREHRRKVKR